MSPKIYCIVTTSLIQEKYTIREQQYRHAISRLLVKCKDINIKIILVENNNLTSSFLDEFGLDVFYTKNNIAYDTTNYGIKEAHDVLDCIKHYGIDDDDYVIKMTGRYFLSDHSPFFDEIFKLETTQYEAIIKYGWWEPSPRTKHENCITGLICMKAKYIKNIDISNDTSICLEWQWAKVTLNIPDDKVCILNTLGINISPKCYNNDTFMEV